MNRVLAFLIILILPSACVTADAHTSVRVPMNVPDGYQLVWSDEFNRAGLPDKNRWAYSTYWNKTGWFNEEQQYYAKARMKNSRVEDGRLIIEAHKEPVTRAKFRDSGGQDFTSARLFSVNNGAWQYGFFEIRAKFPCGAGVWPAIWTLPSEEDNWPIGGEIDIVEFYGHKPSQFEATVHTPNMNHTLGNNRAAFYITESACGEWYTHELHWTEDIIRVSIDGIGYYSFERESDDPNDWPFAQPHYLVLNMAIRNWKGGEDGIDLNAFPARMEVDYVRVYQKRFSR